MSEQVMGNFSGFVLTNLRIRQRYSNLVKSALLDEVDAAGVLYKNQIGWLIVAALTLLGSGGIAAAQEEGGIFGVGVFFAIVCVVIYFLTRKVVFVVCAGSMEMIEVLQGDMMKESVAFIDAIEHAKMTDRAQRG
jgi:hypothetical protein